MFDNRWWGVRPATSPPRTSRGSWALDSDLTYPDSEIWVLIRPSLRGTKGQCALKKDLNLAEGYVRRGRLTNHYGRSVDIFWWRFQSIELQRFSVVWVWPVSHNNKHHFKGRGPTTKIFDDRSFLSQGKGRPGQKVWAILFFGVIVNVNFDTVDGSEIPNNPPFGCLKPVVLSDEINYQPQRVQDWGKFLPQLLKCNGRFQLRLLIGHDYQSSGRKVFPSKIYQSVFTRIYSMLPPFMRRCGFAWCYWLDNPPCIVMLI